MTVARTSDQEAADKLDWSLQIARASILHACSPHASTQDTPIYLHLFVRSSEWAGNARARWSLARRTRPEGACRPFTYMTKWLRLKFLKRYSFVSADLVKSAFCSVVRSRR